jgi:type IV secretory pathway TraG/TraD family ATPase VirD4
MNEQSPHRLERHSPGHKLIRLATEVLAVAFVIFNWLATQRAAVVMHYGAFLSGRMVAHVYQPFGWLWWQHSWPNGAVRLGTHIVFLAALWRSCEHLVLYPMLVLGGIAGLCGLFLIQQSHPADLHGSATWATTKEIKEAGLL